MQGHRSTLEPFCETMEIGRASGSSNLVMDQQVLWNDHPVPVDNQDLSSNPPSSSGNISCANVASHESASLNFWGPDGSSSSMPPLNQGSDEEMKLERVWISSVAGNRVGGLRITGGGSEVTNTASFENENTDLSNNNANDGENPLSEFLDFNTLPHNSGFNAEHVGMDGQVQESLLHSVLPNPVLMRCLPISFPSSSSAGSSSKAIDFFSNNVGVRQEAAQCSSGKRKSIERGYGECSAGGNSGNLSEGVNHVEEEICTRVSTIPRGAASSTHHPCSGITGNGEGFLRNTRMRMSHAEPAETFTSDLWPQESNVNRYYTWPAQPSSAAGPSNQSLDFRLSGSIGPRRQRHVRTTPVLSSEMYPFPQNGISTTEVGSSSAAPALAIDGAPVGLNTLAVSNIIPEQVFAPPINTRNMVHNQLNWGSTNRSTVLSGNAVPTAQIGASLGAYQSPGANWLTHQHRRRLSEAVRRSFFSSGSEARVRSTSLPPRHNISSTSQEVGRHQSGDVSRAHPHPYMRLNMLHRQNSGALGIPLSARTLAATREGRSRMAEIRNVFELIRRGDNLSLEDVLLLEQSAGVVGGNLQDRYRDMRLDVDNMSYEELLALGERIGNVNTGLTEEKILDCLREWKFVHVGSESSEEIEPCCICREEYIEGEDLGRLDCGHDFHAFCIKKWLVIKNLCPICKTPALST